MKIIHENNPIIEFLKPKLDMPKKILDIKVKYEIFATKIEKIIPAFFEKLFFILINVYDQRFAKIKITYSIISFFYPFIIINSFKVNVFFNKPSFKNFIFF